MTPHSRHTSRSLHALWASLAFVLATLVVLTLASTASAAAETKCGDKVLADWFDNGRIDRLYPLHCYEDAIDAIPMDIRDYADAEEVISRALQSALRGDLSEGGCDPSADGSKNDCVGGPRNSGAPAGGGEGSDGSGTSGESEATPEIDAGGPSSVPIPLLVLGGISLALLAAGGLGYLSRRRQAARELAEGHDDPTLL